MKRILFSLAMIAAVGAVVVGATGAYFSDTETSADNTFTAGTIDISLSDPVVTKSVDIPDMKPGMTQWIEFDVHNDGVNPVVVRKMLDAYVSTTGDVSEPECTDQQGVWEDQGQVMGCTWGGATDENDMTPYITYDMELTKDGQTVVLIPESRGINMEDVEELWVPLWTLEVGETLHVKQSYHLDETVTNWAQGDVLTFDISIMAEQRMGEGPTTYRGVVMENKDEVDWYPVIDDMWGILLYTPSAETFDYEFKGYGLTVGADYKLVWWDDANQTEVDIAGGAHTADANGEVMLNGSYDFGMSLSNAKFWLRPATWTPQSNVNTLWEGNVVEYQDTTTT